MNRSLKLSLLCAGIFACGAVVGALGMRRFMPPPPHKEQGPPAPPPEGFSPRMMRKLAEDLALTDAQREAILPILQKTGEELRKLRQDSFRQTSALIEAMEAAVAAQLNDEQRAKLAVLQAEQKARMKTMMEERQRRRGENGERTDRGERPDRGERGERRAHPPEDGAAPPATPPPPTEGV